MSLLRKLRRYLGQTPTPSRGNHSKSEGEDVGPWSVRRWDSAKNNACNPGRWQAAHGQSINNDLTMDLAVLMARCAHEVANDPNFEAVVNQFKRDVVGTDGPKLQIVSDDDQFNDDIEEQWRQVFSHPNPKRPSTGGVESMKQWVHLLLTAGSYINVFMTPPRDGFVHFGWRTLHPRRLASPLSMIGNRRVSFGIHTDSNGDPIRYYLRKPQPVGNFIEDVLLFDTLQPHQMQHRYMEVEPEQVTGFPMMASSLGTAADIREMDNAELRAQVRSAKRSDWIYSNNPANIIDPDPIDDETINASDDEINVAPRGWMPMTLDSNRPSQNHIAYRRERLSELGRPIGMPLLYVILTAAEANFSSTQFESMMYGEAIADVQSFIARLTLNEMIERIVVDRVLAGKVRRPVRYEANWTHHVPPNANFEKFAKGLRVLVEDGVISRSIATAKMGFDPEKVEVSREKENQRADSRGISRPPVNLGDNEPDSLDDQISDQIDDKKEEEDARDTSNA